MTSCWLSLIVQLHRLVFFFSHPSCAFLFLDRSGRLWLWGWDDSFAWLFYFIILASRALCTRQGVGRALRWRWHRGDVCKRLSESTGDGVIRNPGIPLAHDPGPMCIVCCVSCAGRGYVACHLQVPSLTVCLFVMTIKNYRELTVYAKSLQGNSSNSHNARWYLILDWLLPLMTYLVTHVASLVFARVGASREVPCWICAFLSA